LYATANSVIESKLDLFVFYDSIFRRHAELLSRHTIIEMLHAKIKLLLLLLLLLLFSLSIVVEFPKIIVWIEK
jgi:hypothetical protein